ncbi:putative metal ion transporter YfjQ [Neiella marina]|uniref:Putative metal ion transporter YfjQ n=1 Tax=Neiella marina TaxID=508461 RepID=A0A8J2U840_9GAMM|nr:magnesium transporter CorA family protein [Neiella marina]GGA85846.1 putative metal ion transporter YfjQ [Neiella marina]
MIRVALFSDQQFNVGGFELVEQWRAESGFIWIDLMQEPKEQERVLLQKLGCHSLAIEDAQRDRRPPKVESFDQLSLVLYRGFSKTEELLDVKTMALAAFVGEQILITRRTEPSFGVEALWQDEKLNHYIRSPALLLSKIMNASAIRYTESILEAEDEISDLEDAMLTRSNDELMHRLILLKSHLRKLHRIKSYHVKLVRQILSGDVNHLPIENAEIKHSFRDVFDKFERLESLTAMYYDLCGDLIEGYISLSSHQLNKTMQLLTVVSAIFVPLTFIAGIYGMNFEHIPELSFKYGYFVLWGFMLLTASGLLVLFRRKRWL